ncbi:ATP12 family chaperone protein [Neorhizobium galegae]|uniref:ATP12 family chaperone protein n=1 Tax=Neorhizobium galegae TaxID=399 RepID=UPI0006221D19|nr:ATP12 family chaperone protein [Neorhizobium galegae]CDZ27326.1 ATP12 ATPase [Neorhizobium galegae bv. officinalis]KAA9387320.1 ATPase [Neorhizobium galegae]KAB1114465.1 ATPase [Neorhizobium galegae]MCM2496974.1 ATP12 family chaperone protein [Neorhizobium galegae]MCQ1771678.1 ATP12 family chaperone protein [Neorhizobium galegae]
MRDMFPDPSEALSHPDPTRRAQIQMHKPLPKRFYKEVSVAEGEDGHAIHLDGRPVRTPAKNGLVAPTARLAELIRDEWANQVDVIDPGTMPVTRLVNTAIDGIATDPQAVFEDILRFSSSDLLCYRAEAPENLVARQNDLWDPIVEWAANELGARFILVEGVMPQEQPKEATAAFAVTLRRYDTPIELAVLHTVTTLTGSAILALAFAEGRLTPDEAWTLAHLDEDWTNEHWGADSEAENRRAKRLEEMRAAAETFLALKPSA